MKACKGKCGEVKALSEFNNDSATKDKLCRICRACARIRDKKKRDKGTIQRKRKMTIQEDKLLYSLNQSCLNFWHQSIKNNVSTEMA